MGIKWSNFIVHGIDVSKYNGIIDWDKVKASGCDFAVIRMGYGKTVDPMFLQNWKNAKGKVIRMGYWYMDYYSGYSGASQADLCWSLIKDDYDIPFVVLDIESGGSSYSPNIYTVWTKAQTIARDFFARMKVLRGTKFKSPSLLMRIFKPNFFALTTALLRDDLIYCSLSMTQIYDADLKEKPLWVAWYDEMMTANGTPNSAVRTGETVVQAVRDNGWAGKIVLWQYSSDGDIDDNGTPDGITVFGAQLKEMDLNGWLGTLDEWKIFSGGSAVLEPVPPIVIPEMSLYYPLPEGIRISQIFGVNPQWYSISKGHNGIDWACITGTPIYAMQDGTVIRADALSGKVGYGRHVRIQHEKGVSIYGHLSKLLVKVGDKVVAGQIIGLSGGATTDPACGNSTGAHLHGEFRLDGVQNLVPGGYQYNAINILPLLKSYPNDITIKSLYDAKVIVSGLNVRAMPNSTVDNVIKVVGNVTLPVYEEVNGFGRINKVHNEWILVSNPQYVTKSTDPLPPVTTITNWIITATNGVYVRDVPNGTKFIASLLYNQKFQVSSIDANGWGKLYGRDGYVLMKYARQI